MKNMNLALLLLIVGLSGCLSDGGEVQDNTPSPTESLPNTPVVSQVKVLAFNDLGMHCMDK